jgi:hypothetical protein
MLQNKGLLPKRFAQWFVHKVRMSQQNVPYQGDVSLVNSAMKRMLSRTPAPQVFDSSSVPCCIFIYRLFQYSVITVVPVPAAASR